MGFWTDWLDSGDGTPRKVERLPIHPDSDARTKLDKLCGVPMARDERCVGCERHPKRCRCDKALGRPRRWYE